MIIYFIEIIASTVATVVIIRLLALLYRRQLLADIFIFECQRDFNYSIADLPEYTKRIHRHLYKNARPGYVKLLFSPIPLRREYWFSQNEINLFFIKKEGNTPNN